MVKQSPIDQSIDQWSNSDCPHDPPSSRVACGGEIAKIKRHTKASVSRWRVLRIGSDRSHGPSSFCRGFGRQAPRLLAMLRVAAGSQLPVKGSRWNALAEVGGGGRRASERAGADTNSQYREGMGG